MLYEPKQWQALAVERLTGSVRAQHTIVDNYGAVRSGVAVCALLDSMVALVRRLADVVGLGWSLRRRVATARRLRFDIINAIDHRALMSVA